MHGVSPFLFPGCGRYAAGEKNRARVDSRL